MTLTLVVRFADGPTEARIESLTKHLPDGGPRIAVLDGQALDETRSAQAIDAAMRDVRPDTPVRVVHAVGAPAPSAIVDLVESADGLVRRLCPGAAQVSTWLVLDIDRAWDPVERRLVAAILGLPDTRLGGVAVVTSSTMASVAGSLADRQGILADLVWALGPGGMAAKLEESGGRQVWSVGTASLVYDGIGAFGKAVLPQVLAEFDRRPLRVLSAPELDAAVGKGQEWVATERIGSETEREGLLAGSDADVRNRFLVDPGEVQAVLPEDWARYLMDRYRHFSGTVLALARRTVDHNARVRLAGRGSTAPDGLTARFDATLRSHLNGPMGLRGAAGFIHGVARGLDAALETAKHPIPIDREALDRAEHKLRARVAQLPTTPAAILRLAMVTLFAVAAFSGLMPEVVGTLDDVMVRVLAALAVGIGAWLPIRARSRAERARTALSERITQRLEWLIVRHAQRAQVRMIEQLRREVGELLDPSRAPTRHLEEAVPSGGEPPTRAERLRRLFQSVARTRADLAQLGNAVTNEQLRHAAPLGRFSRRYPEGPLAVTVAEEDRNRVSEAVARELTRLDLDSDTDTLTQRISSAVALHRPAAWSSLAGALSDDPELRRVVTETLATDNTPAVTSGGDAAGVARYLLLPVGAADHLRDVTKLTPAAGRTPIHLKSPDPSMVLSADVVGEAIRVPDLPEAESAAPPDSADETTSWRILTEGDM